MSPEPLDCWLCGRRLGARTEWHHPMPKSRGGRKVVPLHPICHRTIHAVFSNTELARIGQDLEAVRTHERIAKFVKWIKDKPADFHAPTKARR
jgi:hypothetical protein